MWWLAVVGSSLAFYDNTLVKELTSANFNSLVIQSKDYWFVEFYAPWCGHCKNLVPEWTKLASALDGIVKVGAVDATQYSELGQKYGVSGFPTIKFFGAQKGEPVDYQGGRSAKEFSQFALKELKSAIQKKLGIQQTKSQSKAVVELSESDFEKTVLSGDDDLWLVSFYAPWCGHCKALHPQWERAAAALVGKAKLGAVDATKYATLASKLGVNGYPTIKVFRKGQAPSDYQGQRTSESIVDFVESLQGGQPEEDTEVVTLTQANFEQEVLDSPDTWLVEFYAPWCGHCKALAPHWKQAAKDLQGKVKLGAVDCTAETKLQDKYKIQSYPTIKVFQKGRKDEPTDFDGRTASGIVAYGEKLHHQDQHPPEVLQLTSGQVFSDQCGQKTLCLIAFLPHILDTGASGRQDYLSTLLAVAAKNREHDIGLLWSEAVAQETLENSLGIGGAGYPALAIVSVKKQRYIGFAGEFSVHGVNEFVQRSLSGREKAIPLTITAIVAVDAWDGTDATAIKTEL